MAITISQEPKRTRDGIEVFFVAVDNGMWFEFEAGAGEIKIAVDVYLADATQVNSSDIVLFFGIDGKVFFDASPYIQPYLNNDNDNTYQSAVETDVNASQGFYLKYSEYPVASPPSYSQSSTYYATKAAKQFGDTYGQNMASYWAASSQVVLAKLLTKQKTLPYWSGFPFSVSFIDSSYVDAANITQLDNTGAELSNVDYPALTDNTIEQVNILSINANTKKINVSLGHTPAFTFTVDTRNPGSASDTIELPLLSSGGTYSGIIDWGDDSTSSTSYANRSHTYSTGGIYTIKVTGTITGLRFNNGGDKSKITNISEWGNFNSGNQTGVFYGCDKLTITATDLMDLTGVNTLQSFFRSCIVLDYNLSDWDVSNITDLSLFLSGATSFDSPLTNWKTGSCTNYQSMFQGTTSFNQDIGSWTIYNGAGITNFSNMFNGATAFDNGGSGTIGNWNTSKIANMSNMFINSGITQSLNNWDVSNVTTFVNCFYGTSYNQPLNSWNMSSATNLEGMFQLNTSFNSSLANWNTSNVTTYKNMFNGSTAFNQDLSTWTISTVGATMERMFQSATAFKQDLSSWNFQAINNLSVFLFGVDINSPYSKTLGSPSGSNANYDALISKLESDANTGSPAINNLSFHGGNSEYTSGGAVQTAHNNLTTAVGSGGNGWTITDGGAT